MNESLFPDFLPVWLQKSWGPWTTYGGGGYWINPGEGNKDWWQFGWLIQRSINSTLTLGAELYYKTANTEDGESAKGYTVGAVINITENHHILLSAGQDIDGPKLFIRLHRLSIHIWSAKKRSIVITKLHQDGAIIKYS